MKLKHPYLNSLFAEIYIILIVSIISLFEKPNTPDTFFTPVAVLSLFVLSASVMGYLFLGEPILLYLDGEKKKAVSYFTKTVASFAVITIIVFVILRLTR